jgi:hypothetical protein
MELRAKLLADKRRASGLPQATAEQRIKVRALKAANKAVPGITSKLGTLCDANWWLFKKAGTKTVRGKVYLRYLTLLALLVQECTY